MDQSRSLCRSLSPPCFWRRRTCRATLGSVGSTRLYTLDTGRIGHDRGLLERELQQSVLCIGAYLDLGLDHPRQRRCYLRTHATSHTHLWDDRDPDRKHSLLAVDLRMATPSALS